jgi:MraZ protein
VFWGQYHHSLDNKGRVILPSKIRNELKEGVFITVWPGPCLLLIPHSRWPIWEDKLITLSKGKRDSLNFTRFFYANLREEKPDRQGRISLAPEHIKWAKIEKNVVIIGVGDRLEMWSKEKWSTCEKEIASAFPRYVESLDI